MPAAAAVPGSTAVAAVPTGIEDEVSFSTEYESATCSIHCFYKKEKESQILEDHFARAIREFDEGSASPNSEKRKGKGN